MTNTEKCHQAQENLKSPAQVSSDQYTVERKIKLNEDDVQDKCKKKSKCPVDIDVVALEKTNY